MVHQMKVTKPYAVTQKKELCTVHRKLVSSELMQIIYYKNITKKINKEKKYLKNVCIQTNAWTHTWDCPGGGILLYDWLYCYSVVNNYIQFIGAQHKQYAMLGLFSSHLCILVQIVYNIFYV